MITIATLFWAPNDASLDFSRAYSEDWVEKLYRGFARNLSQPFRFVCFTDRPRTFAEPIEQVRIRAERPDYSTCIEPYSLDCPMILCGLDTVVTGPCDDLAEYCERPGAQLLAPLDPYNARQVCNGVTLVPGGLASRMWSRFDGRNDMDWIRANPHGILDHVFPGRVLSFKVHVAQMRGARDPAPVSCDLPPAASIVYFHGLHKPCDLSYGWIAEHWR